MIAALHDAHDNIEGYTDVPHTVRLIRWGDTYYALDTVNINTPSGTTRFTQVHAFIPRNGLRKTRNADASLV